MVDNSPTKAPHDDLSASLRQAREILNQTPSGKPETTIRYRPRKCPLAVLADATDTVIQCREAGNPKAVERAEREYHAALQLAFDHVRQMDASLQATAAAIRHHKRRQRRSLPWHRRLFDWLGS